MTPGPVDRAYAKNAAQHGIGHDAGMPSIAVRKRMDEDQAVMKAHRGFNGSIRPMLGPVARVIYKGAQFDADMERIDADVLAGAPERAGPVPHLAEQPLVEG